MSAITGLQIADLTEAEWEAAVEIGDDELRGVAGAQMRTAARASTCHVCGGPDCD